MAIGSVQKPSDVFNLQDHVPFIDERMRENLERVSKNLAWARELATDEYYNMNEHFRDLVSDANPLMFILIVTANQGDKAKSIFHSNSSRLRGFLNVGNLYARCKVCFGRYRGGKSYMVAEHIKSCMDHIRVKQYAFSPLKGIWICPLGCDVKYTSGPKELMAHYHESHAEEDLEKWGVNKEMLAYIVRGEAVPPSLVHKCLDTGQPIDELIDEVRMHNCQIDYNYLQSRTKGRLELGLEQLQSSEQV